MKEVSGESCIFTSSNCTFWRKSCPKCGFEREQPQKRVILGMVCDRPCSVSVFGDFPVFFLRASLSCVSRLTCEVTFDARLCATGIVFCNSLVAQRIRIAAPRNFDLCLRADGQALSRGRDGKRKNEKE